jgi:FMN-dependent NADH-azoreductase
MKLLHIDSSITGTASASRQLTAQIVASLQKANPGIEVIHRDLEAEPLPHLNNKMLAGMAPDAATDAATRNEISRSFSALDEFLAADIVVIGAPMYNFSISSQLKSWIDRVVVAGKTFTYTAEGPKGLAGGKKVIIASSRGGAYVPGTPYAALDFQETYLRSVLKFIGIEDVEFVRAEGIAIGPEQREAAMQKAFAAIAALAASLSAKAA